MKHPIGYASFSSDQLPVEDFRVGAGSEEIVSAVRKADRLYILSSSKILFSTDISPHQSSLYEISKIEEGVTNIMPSYGESLMVFQNGEILIREKKQDEFQKVIVIKQCERSSGKYLSHFRLYVLVC